MRASAMLGALLMASASAQASGKSLPKSQQQDLNSLLAGLPGSDGKTRRSNVKPDRPAKKTNRGNVSARVRRRHRRS